jgi:hypothetical protein
MRFMHAEVDSLPGCSQIAVMHSAFIPLEDRKKGKGGTRHRERLAILRSLGYDAALCTVDLNNKPQLKILKKCGWIHLSTFKSQKTGHKVGVFVRGLGQIIEQSKGFPLHEDKFTDEENYYEDIKNIGSLHGD